MKMLTRDAWNKSISQCIPLTSKQKQPWTHPPWLTNNVKNPMGAKGKAKFIKLKVEGTAAWFLVIDHKIRYGDIY